MDINKKIQSRLTLFSHHYKAKFGNPIGKIALSSGAECPNRKKGGCVYCSPASFTPFYLNDGDSVQVQLAKGKKYLNSRKFKQYLGYFQQETTTAAPEDELLTSCNVVLSDPACVGLIISTRPDYIERSFLQGLHGLVGQSRFQGKEVLFELGLQTAHEPTLAFLNRNHSYGDFVLAAHAIREFSGFTVGVHLILGLPGENVSHMRQTVKSVCAVGVDAIKFHHLQVIENTKLHKIFTEMPFKVYSAVEYLSVLADIISYVPKTTVLHRLWSSSDRDTLVAPDWGGLRAHQLNGILVKILEEECLWQGKNSLEAMAFSLK